MMVEFLTILGSLASIACAIWAFIEAQRSRHSATEARAAADEITNRRRTIEISRVHAETNRILRTVSRVGPSTTPTSIKTVKPYEIAKEVEEYTRYLNEHQSHFDEQIENRAKRLCNDLKDDIKALAEAKDFDTKKAAGTRIYYKINDFLPIAKAAADTSTEQPPIASNTENHK